MTHLEARFSGLSQPVAFEDFMEAALYDPAYGYYMRGKEKFGWRGDFTTAPVLHASLGQAMAQWLKQETAHRRGRVTVIETGAGTGQLANQILKALGWWGRRRIDYRIVEISPWLRAQQQTVALARRITWHPELQSALQQTERPLIISNEFVDAFPCLLLQYHSGEWHRIGLEFSGNEQIKERLLPLETMPFSSALELRQGSWPKEGQRVEVQASYDGWFRTHFDGEAPCTLLTIDYGDRFPALYHRRPRGTLRAFFHQMRLEGEEVYQRAGQQDITADVNFTDLEKLGVSTGFHPELQPLREFVKTFNPDALQAMPDLYHPAGAGGAFQVLTLRR